VSDRELEPDRERQDQAGARNLRSAPAAAEVTFPIGNDTLARRSFAGLAGMQIVLAVLLFVPAGSLRYYAGWAYWAIVGACSLVITLYFLRHDRALVERRLRSGPLAETQRRQQLIQAAASGLIGALMLVCGLDYRFTWSELPGLVVSAADALVVAGFAVVFRAFRANSFAAGTIMSHTGQHVVSSGPYRFVRHPMYSGAMLALLATPFALGSLGAAVIAAALCAVIVLRLLEEERYLRANLSGYVAYTQTVRYRLVPLLW
jgi:protein-S-isoprenylcysteine O-methyltransferase Ste14